MKTSFSEHITTNDIWSHHYSFMGQATVPKTWHRREGNPVSLLVYSGWVTTTVT